MTTTVQVKSLANTLKNLNASIDVTAATPAVGSNCGLYALINQMISDLSSLKSTIKTAERDIETLLTAELETSTSAAANVLACTTTFPSTLKQAEKTVTTIGGTFTETNLTTLKGARNEETTLDQNVGIIINNLGFTELALLNGLTEAYGIINKVKNGQQVVATTGINST